MFDFCCILVYTRYLLPEPDVPTTYSYIYLTYTLHPHDMNATDYDVDISIYLEAPDVDGAVPVPLDEGGLCVGEGPELNTAHPGLGGVHGDLWLGGGGEGAGRVDQPLRGVHAAAVGAEHLLSGII